MNMLLHGISADGADEVPIEVRDALGSQGGKNYEMVMTNPPFGKKSSVTIVNEKGEAEKESLTIHRDDFWASTSNKQLNFLQHVFTILKQHGRAAIVVPDNVLFEGGAGETVRRELLKQADVHTLLRLPTGIFYAQGVKANVLFFDRKPAQEKAWTEKLWIYDLRTNKHFTLKENQLKRADLDDFVACYHAEEPPPTHRKRTLQVLPLRRPHQTRQGQPRHLLAQRRIPRRLRQSSRARHHRRRNHGGFRGGAGTICRNRDGSGIERHSSLRGSCHGKACSAGEPALGKYFS